VSGIGKLESRKKETEKNFKDAKQAKQKGKCLQFSIKVMHDHRLPPQSR